MLTRVQSYAAIKRKKVRLEATNAPSLRTQGIARQARALKREAMRERLKWDESSAEQLALGAVASLCATLKGIGSESEALRKSFQK